MSDLAGSTSPEVPDGSVVLVPVGSTEQHGPHLPLGTDTVIAAAVADRAARELVAHGRPAVVGPALPFGSSGEHQSFAGTISIGTPVLHEVLVELTRSVSTWASRLVLVNAHGGNIAALRAAVDRLAAEGHDVSWAACATEAVDLHAGRTETSLMLHLRPEDVRLDRAEAGNTGGLAELLPAMTKCGVAAVSPNGVLGDPAGASAAEGQQILESMVRDVTEHVLGSS